MAKIKHEIKKISVIYVNDKYLAYLFGMENNMDAYIQDELEHGNIDEDDMDDIKELQAIIREELKTSNKVKVEYKKDI